MNLLRMTKTRCLVALTVMCICKLAAASPQVDAWHLLKSRNPDSGHVTLFRYARSFQSGFQHSALPDRVILAWRYESPSGMPPQDLRNQMDSFEDRLAPLVDAKSESVLVLVSTGENLREWVFYVSSKDRFLGALKAMLPIERNIPIEIHTATDPGWSMYQTFLNWSQKANTVR